MTTCINCSTIVALLTPAARDALAETGGQIAADVHGLANGTLTRESLLAHCLDGADPALHRGWTEYVTTLCEAMGVY